MRLVLLIPMVLAGADPACINHVNVQCGLDPDCNLMAGGLCTAAAGTSDRWCAYPDLSCGPDGYRYSTLDVGDGVAGVCVPPVDAPPPSSMASCIALPNTCGASVNDNCCNSLDVPQGTYFRSYDVAGDIFDSGDMNSPATISAFRLDKYEVTVGRFREFVAANQGTQVHPPAVGAATHPNLVGSGWQGGWNTELVADKPALVAAVKCDAATQTWTDMPGANETRPMNCVTWYEAMAFCIWDGGYLPTEAEWNYAATGGDQQRAYPWSNPASSLTIDSSHATYGCMPNCSITNLPPVGTLPAGDGRWGHSDLAGGVTEWVLDLGGPYRTPCMDCANLAPSQERIARGGDYEYGTNRLRTSYRDYFSPLARFADIGIRCARHP